MKTRYMTEITDKGEGCDISREVFCDNPEDAELIERIALHTHRSANDAFNIVFGLTSTSADILSRALHAWATVKDAKADAKSKST